MRKEIFGILLFFLVIFTLISLLSYSPADPSINNARASGQINNLFGAVGAHLAGMLIGLFGLGAFLGAISGASIVRYGLRTVVAGVVSIVLSFLLGA